MLDMVQRTNKAKKTIKIPTPVSLGNVAAYYLTRFAASEASLRRVLQNKIRRASMAHPDFAGDAPRQQELLKAIDNIVAQHVRSGAVNDTAFAETKVTSLRRQGRSRRVIQQKLALKGVQGSLVEAALAAHADGKDEEEVEFAAAIKFAKRKRLGSFRAGVADREQQRKDIASMARAGYSMSIIRRVLDTDSDALDEMMEN